MTHTSSRILQYLGLILTFALLAGGYWYWQTQASTQKRASTTGLVGYWSFDEGTGTKAGDASGRGNTGTLTNGPTWVDGKFGKAVSFDGVNDYIEVATTALNFERTNPFSVSIWYKNAGPQSGSARSLFGNLDSGNIRGWAMGPKGIGLCSWSKMGFYLSSATIGNYLTVCTQNDVPMSGWHMVTATYNGNSNASGVKIYIDGVDQSLTTVANNLSLTTVSVTNLRIGDDRTNDFWNGMLDEARVYNRVLTGAEITNLYNLGASKLNTAQTQSGSITSGLVGYWSFNGQDLSGTTAYDRSGSGNNGTLTGGPNVTPGVSGQAVNFDGSDDFISISSVSVPAAGGTISLWFKPSAYDGMLLGRSTSGHVYIEPYNSTTIRVQTDVIATYKDFTVPTYATGQWWHLTVVRSNNTTQVYLNGIESSTGGQTQTDTMTFNQIGRYLDGTLGYWYSGAIDEVRIYNRALSAGEIESLYRLGQPDKINTSMTSPGGSGRLDSGLAGYWPLDDDSGTTATDKSTNGNNGTLTNGPTWTTGQIGGAVSFDGSNDYISVAGAPTVRTLSYWVKSNASSNGGIELNTNQYINDNAIPAGWTSPTIYIDGGQRSTAYGSDIVSNGNFNSNISSWTGDGGGSSISWQNAASGDGSTGYLRFTIQSNGAWDRFRQDGNIISASTSYKVSFWYRTSGITGNCYAFFVDNFTTMSNYVNSPALVPSASWRYASFVMTSNSFPNQVFGFRKNSSIGAGTFDVDAISIQTVPTDYLITDTNWHHVAITSNTGIIANAIIIGRGGLRHFNGTLDEVRMYNRALSADEVSLLYKTTAPSNPDTSLKGYWSFNGPDMRGTTAYDRSGVGNSGTLTGSPAVTPGKIGQGLSFDGSDDYVSVPQTGLPTGSTTLSFWVNPSDTDANQIWFQHSVSGYGGYAFSVGQGDYGTGRFGVTIDSTHAWLQYQIGTGWKHIVVIINSYTVTAVYVNGNLQTNLVGDLGYELTYRVSNPIVGHTRIGALGNGTEYFRGSVDEIRMYNRALSSTEIAALYNSGR